MSTIIQLDRGSALAAANIGKAVSKDSRRELLRRVKAEWADTTEPDGEPSYTVTFTATDSFIIARRTFTLPALGDNREPGILTDGDGAVLLPPEVIKALTAAAKLRGLPNDLPVTVTVEPDGEWATIEVCGAPGQTQSFGVSNYVAGFPDCDMLIPDTAQLDKAIALSTALTRKVGDAFGEKDIPLRFHRQESNLNPVVWKGKTTERGDFVAVQMPVKLG